MILEGLVTSRDTAGTFHVAPMGSVVDESMTTLRLRPFKTSQTYANMKCSSQGVFHVVDDVMLLTRSALGLLTEPPATFSANIVEGDVLTSACRWYEFEVIDVDDADERTSILCRVVHAGRLRDFFGFNRAKHAVVEGAILATRVHLIPRDEILRQLTILKSAVVKTGGSQETEAFALIERVVHEFRPI